MLELEGVTKEFGSNGRRIQALSPIDLVVSPGQFVSIVGPSGCGKSTLLNIIAGLDHADEGRVTLSGRALNGPDADRVVVFQEAALFPWLTAQKNVEFGLRMARFGKKERSEVARRYLRMVHLSRFADAFPHELSGGMRQRVAIARALAMDPALLLMDEPFAALDAQTRELLHEELVRIWQMTGKTIVFVTHNVREAVRLSDRVVLLSARPGSVKEQYQIPPGRPRDMTDPFYVGIERQIMESLRTEIEKVAQNELDEDWVYEKASVLPPVDRNLGSGI